MTHHTGTFAPYSRDRLIEPVPPLQAGICDHCGAPVAAERRTKRGDPVKYCSTACRKAQRVRETVLGRECYRLVMVARVFKHTDPQRAVAARSALATMIAEHIEEIDEGRARARAEGVECVTIGDIRNAARIAGVLS